jgi:large subunit ribosomal protein L11
MAKKKLAATVKIQIQAGQATPAPPVGTALGPHGINIMDFCKAYNAATENQRGLVIPAVISIYEDRSFTFTTKTPPTPFLLRQAAGVEKGAQNVRTEKVGAVTKDQVRKIAETKAPDLNSIDLDGAMRQVEGTARSMGLDVVQGKAEQAAAEQAMAERAAAAEEAAAKEAAAAEAAASEAGEGDDEAG